MDRGIIKVITTIMKMSIIVIPYLVIKHKSKKRKVDLDRFHTVYDNGDYESALFHIDKYLEQKPNDHVGHMYRGIVLKDMDRIDEAIEALKVSISIDFTDHNSRKMLGDVYHEIDELDSALEEYDRAILIEANSSTYFNRGVVHFRKGNHSLAESDLKAALKKEESSKDHIYAQLYYLYKETDKHTHAEKYKILMNQ